MNRIVERRLALWPDDLTRAEAARLLTVEKWDLGRVLRKFNVTGQPDAVVLVDPTKDDGIERGRARRALYAAWALIQEAVGEPDIDRDDTDAIARVVAEHDSVWGPIYAGCRTGAALNELNEQRPDEKWWAAHAPEHWPDHAVDRVGALREKAEIRSQTCSNCFQIHAGECL